eukprot:4359042-Prorocentrum_lima.AAC.1
MLQHNVEQFPGNLGEVLPRPGAATGLQAAPRKVHSHPTRSEMRPTILEEAPPAAETEATWMWMD